VRLGATVDDDRRRSATSAVNFRRCWNRHKKLKHHRVGTTKARDLAPQSHESIGNDGGGCSLSNHHPLPFFSVFFSLSAFSSLANQVYALSLSVCICLANVVDGGWCRRVKIVWASSPSPPIRIRLATNRASLLGVCVREYLNYPPVSPIDQPWYHIADHWICRQHARIHIVMMTRWRRWQYFIIPLRHWRRCCDECWKQKWAGRWIVGIKQQKKKVWIEAAVRDM
jgi:hypothetical protein